MHINQLYYFISVANHLNFTKAAKEHCIAQTAISQQIINLEKELNVQLFYRNKRTVLLTQAGTTFFGEVKQVVANLESAIQHAQLTSQLDSSKYQGTLALGFEQTHEKGLLANLIRNFCGTYPNIKLTLTHESQDQLIEKLQAGTLDFVFRRAFLIEEVSNITWQVLSSVYKDPFCAIMHVNHPLAQEKSVDRALLANERFVHFDRNSNPLGFQAMMRDCQQSGFVPNIVAESASPETLLLLVEAGTGITVLPRSFEIYANKDMVRFVELAGEGEYSELIVAWRNNNFNPAIAMLLSLIRETEPPTL